MKKIIWNVIFIMLCIPTFIKVAYWTVTNSIRRKMMELVQTICKWWPMAKLEDGSILNTDYPARSPKNCIEIIKCWDEENFIEEAWIDITVGDDPEPVKRIPLKREWKLGKSIMLKEESNDI